MKRKNHNDEKKQIQFDLIPDVIPEERKPIDEPHDEVDWDDEDEE